MSKMIVLAWAKCRLAKNGKNFSCQTDLRQFCDSCSLYFLYSSVFLVEITVNGEWFECECVRACANYYTRSGEDEGDWKNMSYVRLCLPSFSYAFSSQ